MSDEQRPESLNFPPPAPEDRSPETRIAGPPYPQRIQPQTQPHPSAPKQKGSFSRGFGLGAGLALGFGAVATVASILSLVAMMVVGAGLVAAGGTTASTGLTTIWGEGGSSSMRAVNVSGTIMGSASGGGLLTSGTYGDEVAKQLDDLTKEDAGAVVMLVNSPGGSIGGSRAISDAIQRYQERTGQKVFVYVDGISASGGVYSTATADEIVANHGSSIGSIGVIMGPIQHYSGVVSTSGTLFESGVTTTGGITSEYLSAGTGKDFGNPWRAMTEQERANYMAGIKNEYQNFVNHVATHRGIDPGVITNEMGAFIFDNARAQEYGLIDATMGRDEFFRHAAQQAGLDPADTRVEEIAAPSGLAALMGATRAFGTAPAVEQGPGVAPVTNATICGSREILAFAGDLTSVCG